MTPFTHPYCAVAPATSGGNFKKGAGYFPCTVHVNQYAVVITTGDGARIDAAPTGSVQIITPGWQRRVGAGTIISMNGKQWSIDFGMAYGRERMHGGKPGFLRVLFGTGSLRKALRRARELDNDFTSALLAAGATHQRAAPDG